MVSPASVPIVLAISGSDSSAGAGIQADLKTIHAHQAYALTVVTAVTAQTGNDVNSVLPVPVELLSSQLSTCLSMADIGAIKVGMLGNSALLRAVTSFMQREKTTPVVVDPVLRASAGTSLYESDLLAPMLEKLFPLATVVTPNLPEAEMLTGIAVRNIDDAVAAANQLLKTGCQAVLLKGGHLSIARGTDVLVTSEGTEVLEASEISLKGVHGTGCALASAIACHLARGESILSAARRAKRYVRNLLIASRAIDKNSGLLDHFAADRNSSPS